MILFTVINKNEACMATSGSQATTTVGSTETTTTTTSTTTNYTKKYYYHASKYRVPQPLFNLLVKRPENFF